MLHEAALYEANKILGRYVIVKYEIPFTRRHFIIEGVVEEALDSLVYPRIASLSITPYYNGKPLPSYVYSLLKRIRVPLAAYLRGGRCIQLAHVVYAQEMGGMPQESVIISHKRPLDVRMRHAIIYLDEIERPRKSPLRFLLRKKAGYKFHHRGVLYCTRWIRNGGLSASKRREEFEGMLARMIQ